MADLPERAEKAAEGSDTDGSSSLALPVAVTQASFLSNYPKGVSGGEVETRATILFGGYDLECFNESNEYYLQRSWTDCFSKQK